VNLTGSCLCGAVKYEYSADPVISGNCHCKDCQKSSGGAYAPVFFVPEKTITVTGNVKYFESVGGSGKKVSRGFCPKCGSQLFAKVEAMPGLFAVKAGTLDDTSNYQPRADVYVSHAAEWDYIAPSATTFPLMPPGETEA